MRRFEEVDNECAARFRAIGYELQETLGLERDSGIFEAFAGGLKSVVLQGVKAWSGFSKSIKNPAAQLEQYIKKWFKDDRQKADKTAIITKSVDRLFISNKNVLEETQVMYDYVKMKCLAPKSPPSTQEISKKENSSNLPPWGYLGPPPSWWTTSPPAKGEGNPTPVPLSASFIDNISFAPKYNYDGTPITSSNKDRSEAAYDYYFNHIFPQEKLVLESQGWYAIPLTMFDSWLKETYGLNGLERFWSGAESFVFGMGDAAVSAFDGLCYVVQHPIKTAEGLAFMYKVMHPLEYPQESQMFALLVQDAIKNCWNDFSEGDYNKKCRMIGRVVGEVVLAFVSDKGVSKATAVLKDTRVFTSLMSKVGKGTIKADDAVTALGKAAEALAKLSFKPGYIEHLKTLISFDRNASKGIVGCHNMAEFKNYFRNVEGLVDADFIEKVVRHPNFNGIYEITYKVPLKDGTGAIIPGKYKIFKNPKTVYDPSVISDADMLKWGEEAMKNGIINNTVDGYVVTGTASNGLKFMGYIDTAVTDFTEIKNFFPIID